MQTKPLKVVITPVRNEAWILPAFLRATSLWADVIIIADQMSTDGSREIIKEFPKVRMVDNNSEFMHMGNARKLLFDEVRKIKEPKLIFAIDADEFLSGDFPETEDWKRLEDARPDDAFFWSWMNLNKDDRTKYSNYEPYCWCVYETEDLWKGDYHQNQIHEWRLPWSVSADESHKFYFKEIHSLHLARVNQKRHINKQRFYQVSQYANGKVNAISMFRMYSQNDIESNLIFYDLPANAYAYYEKNGLDIWQYVNLEDEGAHYTNEIKKLFDLYGKETFALLDIWDKDWCERNGIMPPKISVINNLVIKYLRSTNKYRMSLWVRAIDKALKQIYKR